MREQETDLFGEPIVYDVLLRDKFLEPPFSVLDAKQGNWRKRKRIWLDLGIQGEIGRKENALGYSKLMNDKISKNGTSVFDPALTELMYTWFCPDNGSILDPFAGGSVRGIVANYLDYAYTGLELRQEQVDSNREQALDILPVNKQPQWYVGDSDKLLDGEWLNQFDFIFSCPPYADLEVYSDLPDDLSNMSYEDFLRKYKSIINKSMKLLKQGGFACFVVGEVRDKQGYYYDFVGDTKKAFIEAGGRLYNDAVLLTSLSTAAMTADRIFSSGAKLAKVHQNVLIFKKVD